MNEQISESIDEHTAQSMTCRRQ